MGAPKLLGTIKEKLEAAQQQALPASKFGKAVVYVLGRWPRLEGFLQYPEVELSNNLAENSMRGVALGRKNWIHIGSPLAGPRVAAILSVTESCRRLGDIASLNGAGFRQQNRSSQLFCQGRLRHRTASVAGTAAANQFTTKAIANLLREISALRRGRDKLAVHRHRTVEEPIDFAVVEP